MGRGEVTMYGLLMTCHARISGPFSAMCAWLLNNVCVFVLFMLHAHSTHTHIHSHTHALRFKFLSPFVFKICKEEEDDGLAWP